MMGLVLLLVDVLLAFVGTCYKYGLTKPSTLELVGIWAVQTLVCAIIWGMSWIPLEVILSKKAHRHEPCSLDELTLLVEDSAIAREVLVGSGNKWSEYYVVLSDNGLHSVPITQEAYKLLSTRIKTTKTIGALLQ